MLILITFPGIQLVWCKMTDSHQCPHWTASCSVAPAPEIGGDFGANLGWAWQSRGGGDGQRESLPPPLQLKEAPPADLASSTRAAPVRRASNGEGAQPTLCPTLSGITQKVAEPLTSGKEPDADAAQAWEEQSAPGAPPPPSRHRHTARGQPLPHQQSPLPSHSAPAWGNAACAHSGLCPGIACLGHIPPWALLGCKLWGASHPPPSVCGY